jgi:hypothetical protein
MNKNRRLIENYREIAETFQLCGIVGPITQTGTDGKVESFTIITTEPNPTQTQPHARDPAPGRRRAIARCFAHFRQSQATLETLPAELMDAHDVSPIVNSAKNDGPSVSDRFQMTRYPASAGCPCYKDRPALSLQFIPSAQSLLPLRTMALTGSFRLEMISLSLNFRATIF